MESEMLQQAKQLTDKFLILHCADNIHELGFLTKATILVIEKMKRACTSEDNSEAALALLDTMPKYLDEFWASLLMDAIHALKLRDRREKAWQQGFLEIKDEGKQNSARERNVYGITSLRNYFNAFTDYERVLYGTEDTYRDHVVHVVRTWLIGVYLMTSPQASIQQLDFECPISVQEGEDITVARARALSNEERWAMWTVIALCHDLGYPLEKTYRINDVIERMLSHFGNIVTSRYHYSFQTQHQSINDLTLRVIASKVVQIEPPTGVEAKSSDSNQDELRVGETGKYATALQTKYYAKLAHSLEEFRHGIISCLVLMKTLVYFLETDYDDAPKGKLNLEDARQFFVRREILRAIAAHTCTDIYHLQINTLPFLLLVCDELQEWGRPTLRDMKLGYVGARRCVSVHIHECNFTTGEFRASVEYSGKGSMKNRIMKKFQDFNKLMRAALKDETRKIKFSWEIITEEETYEFTYDSKAGPFEELRAWHGKNAWDIYSD